MNTVLAHCTTHMKRNTKRKKQRSDVEKSEASNKNSKEAEQQTCRKSKLLNSWHNISRRRHLEEEQDNSKASIPFEVCHTLTQL